MTVPVGFAIPGAPTTMAVRVTTAPYTGDEGAADTKAEEVALPMVNVSDPLLEALLASPE